MNIILACIYTNNKHPQGNEIKPIVTSQQHHQQASSRDVGCVFSHGSKTTGNSMAQKQQPTGFDLCDSECVFSTTSPVHQWRSSGHSIRCFICASCRAVWDQVRSSSSKESASTPPRLLLMPCRSPVGSFLASRITCSDGLRKSG